MTNHNGSSRKSALTSVTVKHSAPVAGGKIYKTVQKMDLDRTTAARGSFRVSHPSIHAQWLYLVDEMPSGSFGSLWSSAVVIELFELPGVLTQSCTGLFHVDCPIEREWANRCFQSISEDRSINWSPRLQFPVKSSGSQVHTQNYTQRKAQWASEKRELWAWLTEGSSVPSASWQRVPHA